MSSSSRRVALTAALLHMRLDETIVDLRVPEQRAAVQALNPNGKIPVLAEGDFVLWESHAIMQYLCDQAPGQLLYPREHQARADVNRWLFWLSSHLSPVVGALSYEHLWKQGGPDPDAVRRHEAQLRPLLKVLDDHLATRTWLSGIAVTLADLSLAATLMYERQARLPLDGHVHLRGLLERIHDLAAWRATEPRW